MRAKRKKLDSIGEDQINGIFRFKFDTKDFGPIFRNINKKYL